MQQEEEETARRAWVKQVDVKYDIERNQRIVRLFYVRGVKSMGARYCTGRRATIWENKTEKITNIDKNKRERNEESKVKYNDK